MAGIVRSFSLQGVSMPNIESDHLPERMRAAVTFAWSLLSRKIGGGLITINKEASLQLQYAYVLQQVLPMIIFHEGEELDVALEPGVRVDGSTREIDVLLTGRWKDGTHRIAVEMKCYRATASSGKKRGASDIFRKDVHEDLGILERYVEHGHAEQGVALVMVDYKQFPDPNRRNLSAKCWCYDIADGLSRGPVTLTVPAGGKDVYIELKRRYTFKWQQYGLYWFLETEGIVAVAESAPLAEDP
jgi:hypothetical protein